MPQRTEEWKAGKEIDKLKLLPQVLGIKVEEILDLLEIDKGNIFNVNNGEHASGSGSGNGYVENLYTESKEVLEEVKNLYSQLLQQKDLMIERLLVEIELLKNKK